MCLVSKWRFPKRAKKDIVCYKILEKVKTDNSDEYYTPYLDVKVDITKPLKALGNSITFIDPLEKGSRYIHTISSLDLVNHYIWEMNCSRPVVFKCIIPKGTKYHKSLYNNEYCSRKIIFDREVQSYEIHNIH